MNQFVKVVLDADPGGLITGFSQAEGAVGKFGASMTAAAGLARAGANSFEAAAQVVESAGKKILAVGVATSVGFGAMAVSAASFQTNMLNVRTLMGQDFSNKAFAHMGQDVLDLSRKFPQSANDMAKGLYDIASSGFYGADALHILEVSAKAATAGLSTTATSSKAVVSVLNAYGLGAGAAADVSDALFQTVNLGVVTFEELAGVIGESVGTAAAAKVGYASLGAAIATMTLSGISAAEAGTSTNRVLQSIIDPSQELSAAFQILGYESGAQALQTDGLRGVMDKLRVASQGNITTLLQWFPEIRAARGALALMSNEGQNYARVAGEIEEKQNRAGATQRAYNIQSEAAQMQFQKLMNSVHAFAIEIGSQLLPAATMLASALTTIVGAFSGLPGPMKAVIAYGGLLASIILTVAGAYALWYAKSLLVNFAAGRAGEHLSSLGNTAVFAGTGMHNLGERMMHLSGPFALTRAAFASLAGLGNSAGNIFTRVGTRLDTMGQSAHVGGGLMTGLGNAFTKVGASGNLAQGMFTRIGAGARGLVTHLGTVLFMIYALVAAFHSSQSAASDFTDSIEKGIKAGDPASTIRALNDVHKAQDAVFKKGREQTDSIGGFIGGMGKWLGDLATNLVGIDVIKDSSLDNLMKSDALDKTEKKILKQLKNIRTNATDVFRDVFPKDFGALKGPDQKLPFDSKEMDNITRLASNMGINLSKSMSASSPDRQKLIEEYKQIKGLIDATGMSTVHLTEGTIAQFQEMAKAVDEAGKSAGKAFSSSFDVFSAVDEKTGDVGGQIKTFYATATQDAADFYNNIKELQARGLDSASVANLLQAGPAKAGPIVKAMVSDISGELIGIMNAGEAVLEQISQKIVTIARLTETAVQDKSGVAGKHLNDAIGLTEAISTAGPLASVDDLAHMLGWDANRVRDAAKIFSLNVTEAVTAGDFLKLPPADEVGVDIANVQTRAKHMLELHNAILSAIGGQGGVASSDIDNFIKKMDAALYDQQTGAATKGEPRKKALGDLRDIIQTMPGGLTEHKFLLKLLGQEELKQQMIGVRNSFTILTTPGGGHENFTPSEQMIQFLLSIVGDDNATAKINEFSRNLHLTPQEYGVLLSISGDAEAMDKATRVNWAIEQLQAKNIPVTMDNVDAMVKTDDVKKTLGDLDVKAKEKGNPKVTAHVEGKNRLEELQGFINEMHGKDITVTTYTETKAKSAGGNIFYADGGHNAFITHTQRIFGEPETGGEAYLPLAPSKRMRSTALLGEVASMFGYGLYRMAQGGVLGGLGVPGAGYMSQIGGNVHVHTHLVIPGPVYGDQALMGAIDQKLTEHDQQMKQTLRRYRP